MRPRVILHIDFDSFFASVEQQYQPHLRGKPMGVTAHNSRSCIIAASREAKRFGIQTGSRSFEAYQKCPSLILVSADFAKYFEVSKKFLSIAKDFSPTVEMFSIDEVFIDVTKTLPLFGSIENIVQNIKKRIALEIGEYITVSVGISHNKLLAKLASGLKKPNGVVTITPQTLEQVYTKAELTDICGIGERIRVRLHKIGIYTLLQLKNAPLTSLIAEFGVAEALFLHNVGLGIDDSVVIPYTQEPEVKSVSRNYCLARNEYNYRIIMQTMYELCEEVCLKLRKLQRKSKTVGVSLRGNIHLGFHTSIPVPIDIGSDFYKLAKYVIEHQHRFSPNDYIRQMSVWAGNLVQDSTVQLSLFHKTVRHDKLIKTIDALNERFGDHTIRNGFLLYAEKLTTVVNGYGSDRYERIKLARTSFF